MSELIFVYTTCSNIEQAKNIATYILQKHLCACVNVIPGMKSFFMWSDGCDGINSSCVNEEPEVGMIIKTMSSKFNDLEVALRTVHPYEVPYIIALPVCGANQEYKKWAQRVTKEVA